MTKVKLAATIMLGRDNNGVLEILLLKRNKALAFAGGLWVFPGGKIEPSEIEESNDELEAAHIAAIRETKEEADLDIDKESLIFFSHWTTPVIEPRRYATWFFFGNANLTNTQVKIDDSEIKEHLWVNPQVAIDKMKTGELAMMPPTLMSLQLISKCKTVVEAEKLLRQREPIFTLPVLQMQGAKWVCLYEGDAGYSTSNPEMEGARHRLTLEFVTKEFDFEYRDCSTHQPINGRMHL